MNSRIVYIHTLTVLRQTETWIKNKFLRKSFLLSAKQSLYHHDIYMLWDKLQGGCRAVNGYQQSNLSGSKPAHKRVKACGGHLLYMFLFLRLDHSGPSPDSTLGSSWSSSLKPLTGWCPPFYNWPASPCTCRVGKTKAVSVVVCATCAASIWLQPVPQGNDVIVTTAVFLSTNVFPPNAGWIDDHPKESRSRKPRWPGPKGSIQIIHRWNFHHNGQNKYMNHKFIPPYPKPSWAKTGLQ